MVDFDWYLNSAILPAMGDMAPAQQESQLAMYSPLQMQITTGLGVALGSIILHAIIGFYYAMTTKNDPKSVQGFTDWYGAMWWIATPSLINALLALILLTFQSSGGEINYAITNPLSLAYILGVDMSSSYFNFLIGLRLDTIWAIYLGAVCLQSWTEFSRNKAIVIAAIPSLLVIALSLLFLAM